jgi:eukaryotic-like serine/threonine-protein kinase
MGEQVGQQFGDYFLVRLLGQGNFANVYLGEDASRQQVAIKVLHAELSREDVEQFLAQAETISQLEHPRIVRVLSYGVEGETPFLVMQYVPHGTLRQRHPRGTRLPITTVVSYVKQIAEALQFVHDQGLIHRDVKPHNMLLRADYEVMLSDFGIAVVAQSMGYRVQKVQDFEGTILYAAPEQVRGRARIASDQYALGVVVYEWLCGNWPFEGTVEEIASQHTLTPPPSLCKRMPTISHAVEQVVFKTLAKEPDQRFESIQEFAKALERASRQEQPNFQAKQPTPHPLSPLSYLPTKTLSSDENAPSQATLLTYAGHADRVVSLVWSPEGQRIASSSLDETVHIWDAATGEKVLTYQSQSLQALAIAWSPNGECIASSGGLSSEKVQIWDAATGRNCTGHASYNGHTEQVLALAWSPDGKLIASASEDAKVQVWNVMTGRTIFTYKGHSSAVKAVAWSPDGQRLATGSEDKTVQVWDATRGSNIFVYYAHRDKVNNVAWSRGGTHIASASDDETVQVWDAVTGRKAYSYSGHNGGVTAVSWSPDGTRIASGSLDETVQVWNAITGSAIFTYSGHKDWVSSVSWSPDGRHVASGSWDKTVRVWEG